MRKEIVFAGSGGQGVITASIIFAEAAALHEGYHVVQCQSYGPEARGGSSNSHVILNPAMEVGYPRATQPHFMVCLTQESLDKFVGMLRPGGVLLVDKESTRQIRKLDGRAFNLPMSTVVREKIGLPIVFNVCVVGAFVALTGLVRPESVREVIRGRVPARFLDQNLQAFDLGLELGTGAQPWRPGLSGATS
ncbi:MAG: 2-oxoacid:acceptor oxidoreductase family protein [Myxococcota bacterium]|jgi:2-oxoglutarate ferredoxin oxidoreductase subunit gamma|nr:2-oxoacid:acceptor oxidoreductase family protein [Myxococcota bacterium]